MVCSCHIIDSFVCVCLFLKHQFAISSTTSSVVTVERSCFALHAQRNPRIKAYQVPQGERLAPRSASRVQSTVARTPADTRSSHPQGKKELTTTHMPVRTARISSERDAALLLLILLYFYVAHLGHRDALCMLASLKALRR